MQRRTLLNSLGISAFGLAALGRPASAATQSAQLTSYLTHVDETALEFDHAIELLTLQRAPQTRYDPSSLEVVLENYGPIGRLPPIHSSLIAPLVDSGRIDKVYLLSKGANPLIRLQLS